MVGVLGGFYAVIGIRDGELGMAAAMVVFSAAVLSIIWVMKDWRLTREIPWVLGIDRWTGEWRPGREPAGQRPSAHK